MERRELARMEIIEYLLKIPDALVFKNAEDEVLCSVCRYGDSEGGNCRIRSRFRLGWGVNDASIVHPRWLYLPHANIVDSVEDLLYFIRYVRQNAKTFFRE